MVQNDGKFGFINKKGRIAVSLKYDDTMDFGEGLASVKKDGKYGFINKKGKVVVPFI